MWLLIVATVCSGLFAGAAIYINAVEHPARLSCGTELAVREFAPSYHRATIMQVPLAVTGCITGLWAAWLSAEQHGVRAFSRSSRQSLKRLHPELFAGRPPAVRTSFAPVKSNHSCVCVRATRRTTPLQLEQRMTVPMP
jgi:hypothetical protein